MEASPDAVLVQDFANTRDLRTFVPRGHAHRDGTRDDVRTPQAMAAWLAERGLLSPGTVLSRSEHARVLDLRDTLRAAMDRGRHEGRAPEAAFAVPMRVEVDAHDGPRVVTTDAGVDRAIGLIGAAALRTALSGEWWRLRVCAADDCQWVFYDQSRPGRGRYCAPDTCGNRVKTRAYRRRRAGA